MVETRQRPTWVRYFFLIAVFLMWVSVLLSGVTGSLGWWEVVGAACMSLAAVFIWMER